MKDSNTLLEADMPISQYYLTPLKLSDRLSESITTDTIIQTGRFSDINLFQDLQTLYLAERIPWDDRLYPVPFLIGRSKAQKIRSAFLLLSMNFGMDFLYGCDLETITFFTSREEFATYEEDLQRDPLIRKKSVRGREGTIYFPTERLIRKVNRYLIREVRNARFNLFISYTDKPSPFRQRILEAIADYRKHKYR